MKYSPHPSPLKKDTALALNHKLAEPQTWIPSVDLLKRKIQQMQVVKINRQY